MARPIKQTVAYFPHDTDASEGKTLTIIQAKYGNDGYAFWFKLLQLLGKSPRHYYDFNNPADWEFLLAKTHQNGTETTKDILDTLVVLEAIDAELYKNGIIWCQKFVNGVADAYGRTVEGVPQRPDIPVNVLKTGVSVSKNPPNATETTQRKGKDIKRDNSILPVWIDRETWDAYLKGRKKPTEQAKVLLVKKLGEYRDAGDDPNEVLKRSIMNGWTGIFPLDKKGGQDGADRGHSSKRRLPQTYRTPSEIFGASDG